MEHINHRPGCHHAGPNGNKIIKDGKIVGQCRCVCTCPRVKEGERTHTTPEDMENKCCLACGRYGMAGSYCENLSCDCHTKQVSATPEGWSERFDKLFVEENFWKSDNEDTAFVAVGNIKEFIEKEIAAARAEERQRCLKALPPERIIHDYIPEENTPANRAWNAYREIAIRAITTPL